MKRRKKIKQKYSEELEALFLEDEDAFFEPCEASSAAFRLLEAPEAFIRILERYIKELGNNE